MGLGNVTKKQVFLVQQLPLAVSGPSYSENVRRFSVNGVRREKYAKQYLMGSLRECFFNNTAYHGFLELYAVTGELYGMESYTLDYYFYY